MFDFHQKVHNEALTTLKIPENYKVDYLPEPINVDNEEFKFYLKYEHDTTNNTIVYHKLIIIKNGTVSVSNFNLWDKTIKDLKVIYNEQVVLIKE